MNAIDQYFIALLFITLCKMVLTVESLDEILKSSYSNEIY